MTDQEYLAHNYFGVNQRILWDILQEDLGSLLKKVQELLWGSIGAP